MAESSHDGVLKGDGVPVEDLDGIGPVASWCDMRAMRAAIIAQMRNVKPQDVNILWLGYCVALCVGGGFYRLRRLPLRTVSRVLPH